MTIILDNGAYTLRNMGDVAMLQVAIRRIRQLQPEAEIHVLTTRPDLLQAYCPGTMPLAVESRDAVYDPLRPGGSPLRERWHRARARWRGFTEPARAFLAAMDSAGTVVLAGGGFLNDLNPTQTRPVLRMLADAGARGKNVVLFGQGLGPLESPELIGLLRFACRAGARVGLREPVRGPEIMRRIKASPDNYAVTGDDALELALETGRVAEGKALGFSVRCVGYSGIERPDFAHLRQFLGTLARDFKAPIVPVPISFNPHEDDARAIAEVTGTSPAAEPMDNPEALVRAVSGCRLLLTGTYHAAVFALALGIPCLGFYATPYYRDKLEGLARLFPGGCDLFDLREPGAIDAAQNQAARLWNAPPTLRAALRRAAEEQALAARHFSRAALGGRAPALQPSAAGIGPKPLFSRSSLW